MVILPVVQVDLSKDTEGSSARGQGSSVTDSSLGETSDQWLPDTPTVHTSKY